LCAFAICIPLAARVTFENEGNHGHISRLLIKHAFPRKSYRAYFAITMLFLTSREIPRVYDTAAAAAAALRVAAQRRRDFE